MRALLPSLNVTVRPGGSMATTRTPNRVATPRRAKYAASPVCVCASGMLPASQYGRAMRAWAGSSQTSVTVERPPSCSRIVSIALIAAGPAPMMTWCMVSAFVRWCARRSCVVPDQADARPNSASFSRRGTPSSDQPRSR